MKRRFLACFVAAGAALSSAAYCPAPAAAVLDRVGSSHSTAAAEESTLRPGAVVRVTKTSRRLGSQSLTPKRRRAIGEGTPLETKNTGRDVKEGGATALVRQLRVVMRVLRNQDARADDGLSPARLRALALIESRPGLQVGAFAQELGVHQSTASNLLEQLARQGLVEKRRATDDHRTVGLLVTERARAMLKAAPRGDEVEQALDRLPPSTLAALEERLAELIRALPPGKVRLA